MVRHRILIPAFVGSIPTSPASFQVLKYKEPPNNPTRTPRKRSQAFQTQPDQTCESRLYSLESLSSRFRIFKLIASSHGLR